MKQPTSRPSISPTTNPRKVRRFTFYEASQFFGAALKDASEHFNMCPTVFKKECRKLGIRRWPHRKVRSLTRELANATTAEQKEVIELKLKALHSPEFYNAKAEGMRGLIAPTKVCSFQQAVNHRTNCPTIIDGPQNYNYPTIDTSSYAKPQPQYGSLATPLATLASPKANSPLLLGLARICQLAAVNQ